MGTREAIQGYFACLRRKQGWQDFLADDVVFTSFTSPVKRVTGKGAYLEATKRFYGTIGTFELKRLIVEGENACALTRYDLQPPQGPTIATDVAEVFVVRGGTIQAFDIYFDSAAFPK